MAKKRLEERLSGRFLTATGVFKGLKIPEAWRGKWTIIYSGNVLGPYTSEQAFEIDRLIQEYDSNAHPLIMHVPTKKEEKARQAYLAV